MEYQVTARKWRPQSFGEVIGQEHVTRALTNAIESGKIPHAFLFSGPRGVGKTTTARILAKALNCESGISAKPCQKCAVCESITAGQSLDVREIDGASNRGIDNIREIRDNISYMALNSRFKIIIIDEVHMLTIEASNALLKTLEEPPEHVFFVLATTEPNKVLPTIRSRCQHYLFKRISIKVIIEQLRQICEKEGVQAEEQGLYQIALAADGSMRDAETLFDQVVLYSEGKITPAAVTDIIGIPEESMYFSVLNGIEQEDTIALLMAVSDYIEKFGDAKLFFKGFLNFLRNGLLVLQIERAKDLLELPLSQIELYRQHFSKFKVEEVSLFIRMMSELFRDFRSELNDRFILELLLFRLMDYKNVISFNEIKKQLREFSESSVNSVQRQVVQKPVSTVQNKEAKRVPPIPIWDKDLTTLLKKVLSQSRITKAMISDFSKIEVSGSEIKVFLSKDYDFEFLDNRSSDILKSMEAEAGYPVQVKFVLLEQKHETNIPPATLRSSDQRVSETKTVSKPNLPKQPDEKPAEHPRKTEGGLKDGIMDLFG